LTGTSPSVAVALIGTIFFKRK